MQQNASDEDKREILKFLISAKETEILTYDEKIKKCLEEIKEFKKMIDILDNKI